jgi:hypothetical protein
VAQLDPQEWAEFEAADKMRKLYTKICDKFKAKFQEELGEDVSAMVGREEKATWEYANAYRVTEFENTYPELYEAFSHTEEKRVVNWDLLGKVHPDVVRQFQSRKFVVKR